MPLARQVEGVFPVRCAVNRLHLKAAYSLCNRDGRTFIHSYANLQFANFGAAAKSARKKRNEQQLQVQQAEALFVQFIAEHNLPFRTGDHFTKLVKSMFPDSEVAKQFQCSRTKTSVLLRFGNGNFAMTS